MTTNQRKFKSMKSLLIEQQKLSPKNQNDLFQEYIELISSYEYMYTHYLFEDRYNFAAWVETCLTFIDQKISMLYDRDNKKAQITERFREKFRKYGERIDLM